MILYSDISYYIHYKVFGYHYCVVEDNKIFCFSSGTQSVTENTNMSEWLEVKVVEIAHCNPVIKGKEFTIMTDCGQVIKRWNNARWVKPNDPWYLMCHFAAKAKVLQKIRNRLEDTEKRQKKQINSLTKRQICI